MWHKHSDTLLVEPGDADFWKSFWRTDAFRALIEDPSTGYANMMARVMERPWWFVSPTTPYERMHFAPWFANAFIRREYDNKLIEDLYYWHDIIHAMTFVDASRMNEGAWRLAMRSNEIATSMETEVLIYWRSPGLRALTFEHPIWADTFSEGVPEHVMRRLNAYQDSLLNNKNSIRSQHEYALRRALPSAPIDFNQMLYPGRPDYETLWSIRRATSLLPGACPVEQDLARYEATADPFYDHWAKTWRDVETHRAEFAALCRHGEWKEAVHRRHAKWEAVSNEDGVPYGDLAKTFQ